MDERWSLIYDRNMERIYRVSFFYLHNKQDAEDALQTVFCKAIRKNVTFQDEEHEKAWFLLTTKNYCLDVLKSAWRKKRVCFDSIPEPRATGKSQHHEIYDALLKLPEKYKDVLYLYYFEEYSVREIAELLKRKESTIQTQLADGRRKLKDLLESEVKEYESARRTYEING